MKTLIPWLILSACCAQAADWPQWRGPNRDGISTETDWTSQWGADGPKQLFKLNVGIGCSAVAVSKGRLYTMGNANNSDTVLCLDAATGKPIWKQSYACPLDPHMFEGGPGATPTVDGDRVYTLSRAGHLHCLDAASGKVVWMKHLVKDLGGKVPTWGYAGSPLVLEKRVIVDVGAPGAATVALDKTSGEVAWKSGDEGAGYGAPLAFEQGTGSELRRPLGIAIVGGLLVSQFLTLYTTPVIYLWMDRFGRWVQSAVQGGTAAEPVPRPTVP